VQFDLCHLSGFGGESRLDPGLTRAAKAWLVAFCFRVKTKGITGRPGSHDDRQ
jgi:hypothetical protein